MRRISIKLIKSYLVSTTRLLLGHSPVIGIEESLDVVELAESREEDCE